MDLWVKGQGRRPGVQDLQDPQPTADIAGVGGLHGHAVHLPLMSAQIGSGQFLSEVAQRS